MEVTTRGATIDFTIFDSTFLTMRAALQVTQVYF